MNKLFAGVLTVSVAGALILGSCYFLSHKTFSSKTAELNIEQMARKTAAAKLIEDGVATEDEITDDMLAPNSDETSTFTVEYNFFGEIIGVSNGGNN